jgi:hypothetical protein
MLRNMVILSMILLVGGVFFGCTKRNPVAPDNTFSSTPTATPVVSTNLTLVDDCETQTSQNKLGGSWFVYDDLGNTGTSRVYPKPFQMTLNIGQGALASNGYAGITGTVTTAFVSGFIGMGTNLAPASGIVDLSGYQGIRFFVKGDGKSYSLKIQTASTIIKDFDYFQINFTTSNIWEEHIIPFSTAFFSQQGFGVKVDFALAIQNVQGIQWQTIGQPLSSVELKVDNIYLYK